MKIIRCAFLSILVTALSLPMIGCGFLRTATGVEEYTDAEGHQKIRVSDSLADKAAGLLGLLGPWGIAGATAIGIAQRVIRHREILAHGQKDDNNNGIPDDQENPTPPVPPPTPPAPAT